jgi:hypothetical protein
MEPRQDAGPTGHCRRPIQTGSLEGCLAPGHPAASADQGAGPPRRYARHHIQTEGELVWRLIFGGGRRGGGAWGGTQPDCPDTPWNSNIMLAPWNTATAQSGKGLPRGQPQTSGPEILTALAPPPN